MKLIRFTLLSTLVVLCLAVANSAAQQTSTTTIPNLIRYSGTLNDAQGTASAPHAVGVTFAIYKQQDGGAPLWQETQNVTPEANGQYYVLLGSTKSEGVPAELFSDQDQRWLGVQVEGKPEQARVLMVSVPYAFKAHEAETLGGLPASAFIRTNSGDVQGASSNTEANPAPDLTQPRGPSTTTRSPVSGVGTPNFIPIWTSTTAQGNSALFQIGGNVGLGTTSPGAKLDVVATPGGVNSGGIRGTGTSYGLSGIATALTGYMSGVYGQSLSVNGTGVYGQSVNWVGVGGQATATSGGPAYGVWGDSLSTSGAGVAGYADATSGYTSGVFGSSASTSGSGVNGNATAASGYTSGVSGFSASTNGSGVNGYASAPSGYTSGVYGGSASTSGSGVNGNATATSGYTNGVFGASASTNGNGVSGLATATTGNAYGVSGQTYTTGFGAGVIATANATSGTAFGLFASAKSPSGNGVFGYASATYGSPHAVVGFLESPNGVAGQFIAHGGAGLVLQGLSGSNFNQVFYVDGNGNGYFAGNLNVTGNLSKGSGSFRIDDPLDPANKTLSHSFVESPDMMNIYNGVVKLDANGEAWVDLPQYFEALNRDFRYQLTAIGAPGPNLYVSQEIAGNRFKVEGGKPGAKVSWQVTGVRQDAYANAHRIPVEEDKPSTERGYYLHPDAFGQPQSKGIESAHGPQPGGTDLAAEVAAMTEKHTTAQ